MDAEVKKVEKGWQNDLDGLADLHSRVSVCESANVALSRRVSVMEEKMRGHYDADDPMKGLGLNLGPIMWVVVALTVAPMVLELVQAWRSSHSSQS